MAGSQLKQLKAALKEKGLIGQTNTTSKKSKGKTSRRNEVNRDLQKQNLQEIRNGFNKFDQRINRTKHDISIATKQGMVKIGSKQHNEYAAKNGAMQKQIKLQYEMEKKRKGKTGGILDKRFGENNSHLSQEEKMLARFTRERQNSGGKKRGIYSLESDDDENMDFEEENDNGGFQLTHSGQALSLDDEETIKYVDEDSLPNQEETVEQPPRKKSKNEVMKEIIAKSKFYKQQRQQTFAKQQDQIDELDEDFGDIMDDLRQVQTKIPKQTQFSSKSNEEIEYDNKVRELNFDRRAKPADRTKTNEELNQEHNEKLKKLEQDRLKRMEGFNNDREAEGDDLDDNDGFWGGDESENEQDGFTIKGDDEDLEEEEQSEEEEVNGNGIVGGRPKIPKTLPIIMPSTIENFIEQMSNIEPDQQSNHINKICETYKPNLAQENKEKMQNFVSILFKYILYLSNKFENFEPFLKILKNLSNSYNEELVESMRLYISEISNRIENLKPSDLIFFVIVCYLFSTSDHYHLIVTPSIILMNQILSYLSFHLNSIEKLGQGIFIIDVLLKYQRFSKRFDPEILNFLEVSFLKLCPEPRLLNQNDLLISKRYKFNESLNLLKTTKFNIIEYKEPIISIRDLFKEHSQSSTESLATNLLVKLCYIMDKCITIWKDNSSIIEILKSFISLQKHLIKYISIPSNQFLPKFEKLLKQSELSRKPLTLQSHKQISIPSLTPKFEENFNPDKKSYDINKTNQEISKLKQQYKKERKNALKDIRFENKFIARESIVEKTKMYDEYHKKMSNIVNTIQSSEGNEKNQYEREKKQRKQRK
ncbi:NOP14 [Candida pseudojiufengensis]|uniref:NOP14 n=1 Tax=Candida pseudojiufengensis TaxID=497109 RepID=UPI0022247964|nr:NOP14 [Candida pseudojiufengensis]KAI5960978.1 NOP14 [Candida pseudojiufengensis]